MPTAPVRKPAAKRPAAPKPEYVSKAEFTQFSDTIAGALEGLTSSINALATKETTVAPATVVAPVPVAETAEEKAVRKASANQIGVNPEWEEMAREIIGEAVDHCEMQHLSSGGVIFTVVIKNEFSNAGKDYLDAMKTDRRSKDVGSEGISGVESWCKLIKANLERRT